MGNVDAGSRSEYAVRTPELDAALLQIAGHLSSKRRDRAGGFESRRSAAGYFSDGISFEIFVGKSRRDGAVDRTTQQVRAGIERHVREVRNCGRLRYATDFGSTLRY